MALDKLNSRRYRVHKQRVFDRDGRICRYCGSDEEPLHIDHIIPLSSAKTEDELYKLCHYTNLQPLWAKDNMKKGKKILSNNSNINS